LVDIKNANSDKTNVDVSKEAAFYFSWKREYGAARRPDSMR